MRLLGAFFNIFFFYYFLALCGGAAGNGAESVDNQPVQSVKQEEKPCKPGEGSCQPGTINYSSTTKRLAVPSRDFTEAT